MKKAQLTKLPEWQACLDAMRERGVGFGVRFEVKFLEEHMRLSADDFRFSIAISKVRHELERDGFYLTGRGGRGKFWTIVQPSQNANVMIDYGKQAATALKRGVILGTNTPLDTLTPDERRKHERMLEKLALKATLVQRSHEFQNLLPPKGGK